MLYCTVAVLQAAGGRELCFDKLKDKCSPLVDLREAAAAIRPGSGPRYGTGLHSTVYSRAGFTETTTKNQPGHCTQPAPLHPQPHYSAGEISLLCCCPGITLILR